MAARLLGLAQDSVLEIAQQSGFGNLSYFNRLFRKKYGMTPREFRRHSEDAPAGR
jgi:AraC-like DNA-binding protein